MYLCDSIHNGGWLDCLTAHYIVDSSLRLNINVPIRVCSDFFIYGCSYEVIVRVRTGGRSRRLAQVPVTVTVSDVNDNAPYFTKETYYATVMVSASRGSYVTKVKIDSQKFSILVDPEHALM